MENPQPNPPTRLKPWVAPLAVGSVVAIAVGVIATYANLTLGALIVLIGLMGVVIVGYQASRSVDS